MLMKKNIRMTTLHTVRCQQVPGIWFSFTQSKIISCASAFPSGIQAMLEPSSMPAQESCCCNTDVTSWHLAHTEEVLVAS